MWASSWGQQPEDLPTVREDTEQGGTLQRPCCVELMTSRMEMADLCLGGVWGGCKGHSVSGCSAQRQPDSWKPSEEVPEKTGKQHPGSCPRPRKLSVLLHISPCHQPKSTPVFKSFWLGFCLESTLYPNVLGCPTLSPVRLLRTCQASHGLRPYLSTETAERPKQERVDLGLVNLCIFGPVVPSPASASSSMDKGKL